MSVSLSRSSSMLLELLASLLAPMFVGVTGGDIRLARMAAIGTINDYRAASKADLIAVAQIVAFGLGSIAAIVASMSMDLPLAVMLSLQRNALGLERAAERSRRTLGKYGKGFEAEAEAEAQVQVQAQAQSEAEAQTEGEAQTGPAAGAEQPVEADAETSVRACVAAAIGEPEASAVPELDEIATEPPLFPNEAVARMLEAEAEARLRNPATGPALALPPDLFPRRTHPAGPAADFVRDPASLAVGTAANPFMLPALQGSEHRTQSVRSAALSTTAATRLSDPDFPIKR